MQNSQENTESFEGEGSELSEGKEVEYSPAYLPTEGQMEIQEEEISGDILPKLDRYGFILNVDSNGRLVQSKASNGQSTKQTSRQQMIEDAKQKVRDAHLNDRKAEKLRVRLEKWDGKRRKDEKNTKKLYKSLRKGIPDSMRGKVWGSLAAKIERPGLYEEIVNKTSDAMLASFKEAMTGKEESVQTSPTASESSFGVKEENEKTIDVDEEKIESNDEDFAFSHSFKVIQDTIERDIHRTFPKHSLFYETERALEGSIELECESEEVINSTFCDPDLASMILNLESDIKHTRSGGLKELVSNATDTMNPVPGGQAALRRVLRAYSYYDRDVGYCQGMNFIAGMFLTLMSEEESFWLLVAVMNRKPWEMRGLFREGMLETHMALYVADRLTHQYLPKLARHFDRENIHVTMYATQWLLTLYTSSFEFDLVLRVWDAFLGEGWKIIYRVMLALLIQNQSKLLKMGFEDILAFLREMPSHVNGETVLDAAMKIPLKTRNIIKYELEWVHKQRQAGNSVSKITIRR